MKNGSSSCSSTSSSDYRKQQLLISTSNVRDEKNSEYRRPRGRGFSNKNIAQTPGLLSRQRSLPVVTASYNEINAFIDTYKEKDRQMTANGDHKHNMEPDLSHKANRDAVGMLKQHQNGRRHVQLYEPPSMRSSGSGITEPAVHQGLTQRATVDTKIGTSWRDSEQASANKGEKKLNVYAKEFCANQNEKREVSPQLISDNTAIKNHKQQEWKGQRNSHNNYFLVTSKSSNDVSRTKQKKVRNNNDYAETSRFTKAEHNGSPLVRTKSEINSKKKVVSFQTEAMPTNGSQWSSLRRSKSMSSTDSILKVRKDQQLSAAELSLFPPDIQCAIRKILLLINNDGRNENNVHGTTKVGSISASSLSVADDKALMQLARKILCHVIKDEKLAVPSANFSILIIQEEGKRGTYLDTILNTCQLWFDQREEYLQTKRGISPQFLAFVAFLTEFYTRLQRISNSVTAVGNGQLTSMILQLLYSCCLDILLCNPKHTIKEMERLFCTITTIGRDLENENRALATKLHNTVRDVFLNSTDNDNPEVKKTLLQLIELRAAKWQLPLSALSYYYPKTPH